MGGLAALFCGLVFFWQTPGGTVRIEINDPEIQAQFDKVGLTVSGADKEPLKLTIGKELAAGSHTLHIKRGDFEFETDKFELKKQGTNVLKIELLAGTVTVVANGQSIGSSLVAPLAVTEQQSFDELTLNADETIEIPTLSIEHNAPVTFEGYFTPAKNSGKQTATLIGADYHGLCIEPGGHWQFGWVADQFNAAGWAASAAGRRTHVAGVRSADALMLFIDGKLVHRLNIKPGKEAKIQLHIGSGFSGQIDEVRISKVARYEQDFVPTPRFETDDDTLALYHMDDLHGNILADSSGNNHQGKIIGGARLRNDGSPIASTTAPTPKPAEVSSVDQDKQFHLLREGQLVRDFRQLPGALADLKMGDVIEIQGNGPFAVNLPEGLDKPLDIRAGQGFRPQLVFGEGRKTVRANMKFTGCDIDVLGGDFVAHGESLEFDNCRIRGQTFISYAPS